MVTTLFLLFTLAQQNVPTQRAERASISVTASAAPNTFKLGSDIVVNIVTLNTSNQELHFRMSGPVSGEISNRVELSDERGESVAKTRYHRVVRGEKTTNDNGPSDVILGSFPVEDLEPGKSMTEQVSINKLYEITRPGKYKLEVERQDPITKALVKSNTITLTVTP